ncbi:MAG: conjugal transfer protein TrbL [Leucobacter sp.]
MSVCDIPVISAVCDGAGEAAATLIQAPFDWLAQAIGQTAGWFITGLWVVFDTTTLVDVTSPGYVGVYNLIFGIGVFVALVFFMLQLLTGLVKREPGALTRAGLGLAKSILGSFLALTLVALLLEITDQLSLGIILATGNTTATMGDKIGLLIAGLTHLNVGIPGVGAIVMIFLGGLAIAAAGIVWLSLLIRKALLLVAVVLAPLALAGSSWDATRSWVGKWAMFVVALTVSKLVLTVVLLVAVTQTATPIALDLQALTDPLSGIALLMLAAFAPYMTYKFVSFLGIDFSHAISSEQEAKSALKQPVAAPSAALKGNIGRVLGGGRSSGGAGNSGGAGSSGGAAAPKPAQVAPAAGGAAGTGAASGGAAGGAAVGGGAAAGPIGLGAAVAVGAATAGPKLGHGLAGVAEGHAGAAAEPGVQAAPPQPAPSVPPADPRQAPPAPATPRHSGGTPPVQGK